MFSLGLTETVFWRIANVTEQFQWLLVIVFFSMFDVEEFFKNTEITLTLWRKSGKTPREKRFYTYMSSWINFIFTYLFFFVCFSLARFLYHFVSVHLWSLMVNYFLKRTGWDRGIIKESLYHLYLSIKNVLTIFSFFTLLPFDINIFLITALIRYGDKFLLYACISDCTDDE